MNEQEKREADSFVKAEDWDKISREDILQQTSSACGQHSSQQTTQNNFGTIDLSSFQNLENQDQVDVDKFIRDNQQTFTAKAKEENKNALSTNMSPLGRAKGLT